MLADEAADVSKIEQMPLVLRFIDDKSEIREAFMGFLRCDEGLTGEAISMKILDRVDKISLDINLCRGQGYDGAGSMAGKCSGAAARINAKFPKAPYVHCGSHALNLCVASACKIQVIRNMMGQVRVVSEFFNNSPKRFAFLEKQIKEMLPKARHTHLIDVCRTRWIARIDGLDVFSEVFVPIAHCFELIKFNADRTWNTDTVRDASGLFLSVTSFQFTVCLVVVSRCLEVTRPLTKQLQSSTFDVVAANEKVSLLYAALQRMRIEKSVSHSKWYDEAVKLALSVNVDPSRPRTVQRQVHRSNTPAESVSLYYERTVTLPFLDHLTSQIQTEFSDRNMAIFNGFYAFPERVVSSVNWRKKFEAFLEECIDDLPEPRYINSKCDYLWRWSI